VKHLVMTIALSLAAACGGASGAQSQVLGDPPTDYWTYGDVAFDPACMHWNWQERSWYDVCTRLHHPLAWAHGGDDHYGVVIRAKD